MPSRQSLTAQNFFVIDGQQRLQSFYIGLCGSFGGKKMFFDLYSDFQKGEYDFKFAKPTQGVTEPHKRKHIEANIRQFYRAIFEWLNVGISQITVDYGKNRIENRQRMVELFRRLNSGGTPLSTLRNTLSAQQRSQAEKITVTCQILPTDPSEVTDLDDGGEKFAAFALENYPRIKSTPVTLREFLRKTGDYNWYFTPSVRFDSPVEELFDVCKRNLHSFYSQVKPDNLDEFAGNRDYMFYLIYDGTPLSRAAVDHIQPRSRLLELIADKINDSMR